MSKTNYYLDNNININLKDFISFSLKMVDTAKNTSKISIDSSFKYIVAEYYGTETY